jgi:hypothetical protein
VGQHPRCAGAQRGRAVRLAGVATLSASIRSARARSSEALRSSPAARRRTGQQQKLLQLYYNGGVDEGVLKAEQERIETERAQAHKWSEAAVREVQDVVDALDTALILLDNEQVLYETLPPTSRRLVNQAIFIALIVYDQEMIQAKRTPLYEALAQLVRTLQQAEKAQTGRKRPQNKVVCPQNDPDPLLGGQGSYIKQIAGGQGFEPRFSGPKPDVLPLDDPPRARQIVARAAPERQCDPAHLAIRPAAAVR